MYLIQQFHIACCPLAFTPVPPPSREVFAPSHDALVTRSIGPCRPIRPCIWVWLRQWRVLIKRQMDVLGFDTSNFGKRGCNVVHANLISRNFKIHSGRFCRIIEDPSAIGADVIQGNERNFPMGLCRSLCLALGCDLCPSTADGENVRTGRIDPMERPVFLLLRDKHSVE